jgi:ABC-type multidrug transport system ATPase subunit
MSIGRDPSNDIVLDDSAVSRRHLTLTRRGDIWHVAVISGAGPLHVNGRQCDANEVHPGDQVAIGGVVVYLEWLADADAASLAVPGGGGAIRAGDPVATVTVECPAGRFVVPLREASITIGRAPDCGLIIPSRVISAHHAMLQRGADGTYTLSTDPRAPNSFTYGGAPVRQHTFRHGDTLFIGSYESGEYASMRYAAPFGAAAARSVPMELPLGGVATIGRDPASTYCLPSPIVSWHHARLHRDAAGVVLEDLGSTNGSYVNLARVARTQRLAHGNVVQIGPFGYAFDGVRLTPLDDTGPSTGIRVEALDLIRTAHGGRTALLDHVTLAARPGQFITIIGGNGAGKSTLLKALAGIQPAQFGAVLFDGIDSYRHYDLFRGRIGYVPQADIVHLALTVEEALYYTARLRLSSDLREEEIAQRIQLVLTAVDLAAHQGKLVGALSGGERKRLSLAVELLAEPQVLFLDEPNAALDPNHRRDLLRTVRALANQGRTLIMVTHFHEDFEACDQVAVMGRGGRLCFFGSPPEALRFFGVTRYEDIYAHIEEAAPAEVWRKRYQQLPQYLRDIQSHAAAYTLAGYGPSSTAASYRWNSATPGRQLSAVKELSLLLARYARILSRDRLNVAILLLQAPIIGAILAIISKAGAFTNGSGPTDAQEVLFFLAVIAIWFGTSNAVREISKEADIYQRERLAGLRILPYVLSKVGVLALLCVVQTLVLLVIVTAKTGLPPLSAGLFLPPFVELYIGTTLAGLAGLGMGLAVSAFANNPDKAVSAVPLVLLPQILLAGIIFPLNGPIKPFASVTISRWAVQALGTSADLNHLYYVHLAAAGIPPGQGGTAGFSPEDYDASPDASNYTTTVGPDASWTDAVGSREQHLLLTWAVLCLLFGIFLSAAALRQRAKDPT